MELIRLASAIIFVQSLSCVIVCEPKFDAESTNHLKHLRKKRYVVFPEGSVLSVALCVSPTALTEADGIFTSSLVWAISYDLPNETVHEKNEMKEVSTAFRRHKRDLFVRIEKLMDATGFDGKTCIMRTICETSEKLSPRQGILEEIFRIMFLYPPEVNKESKQQYLDKNYIKAHRAGELREDCSVLFPCPISLLDFGFNIGEV